MSPKVSVIIPVFNAESTLHQTLKSVGSEIKLTGLEVEVVAIDDGSTDNSIDILENFSQEFPIQIFKLAHTGSPAEPRNLGIQKALGKYVFFLDADDVLLPGGLTAAVNFADINSSEVVVCRLKSLDGRGVPRGMFKSNQGSVELVGSRIYWALNPMKLMRRDFLISGEIKFDTSLRRDEDQPFALKAYLLATKISVLANPPVVGVRYSPIGTNLTLREYLPEDLFAYLETMTALLDSSPIGVQDKKDLLIRNWEIEISRELIWKRLGLLPEIEWEKTFHYLYNFSKTRLDIKMLPNTSIRWRGIVGLIGSNSYSDFKKLLRARNSVLSSQSRLKKLAGVFNSNFIRLKFTLILPRKFN